MNSPHVEILSEQDRPSLVQMLEGAGDVNLGTVGMYRMRRALPDVTLVAWVADSLVGHVHRVLHGRSSRHAPLESFELPEWPHAFMERIHVHPDMRHAGVGRALVDAFIGLANDNGCTFAGGHVDASSDPTGRIEILGRLGFEIRGNPTAYTAILYL